MKADGFLKNRCTEGARGTITWYHDDPGTDTGIWQVDVNPEGAPTTEVKSKQIYQNVNQVLLSWCGRSRSRWWEGCCVLALAASCSLGCESRAPWVNSGCKYITQEFRKQVVASKGLGLRYVQRTVFARLFFGGPLGKPRKRPSLLSVSEIQDDCLDSFEVILCID